MSQFVYGNKPSDKVTIYLRFDDQLTINSFPTSLRVIAIYRAAFNNSEFNRIEYPIDILSIDRIVF